MTLEICRPYIVFVYLKYREKQEHELLHMSMKSSTTKPCVSMPESATHNIFSRVKHGLCSMLYTLSKYTLSYLSLSSNFLTCKTNHGNFRLWCARPFWHFDTFIGSLRRRSTLEITERRNEAKRSSTRSTIIFNCTCVWALMYNRATYITDHSKPPSVQS